MPEWVVKYWVEAIFGAVIILRKNIKSVKVDDEQAGKKVTVYQCEERQFRVPGAVSAADVAADFDAWWSYTPTEEPAAEVTDAERLDALEAAVYDLAGVVFNG